MCQQCAGKPAVLPPSHVSLWQRRSRQSITPSAAQVQVRCSCARRSLGSARGRVEVMGYGSPGTMNWAGLLQVSESSGRRERNFFNRLLCISACLQQGKERGNGSLVFCFVFLT